MSPARHNLLAYGLPALLLLGGGAALVWPSWQQRNDLLLEIDDLNLRMAGISDQTEVVELLAGQLDEVRETIRGDLKVIGHDASVADIIARLSLPMDGVNVIDQKNLRGSTRPATDDENQTLMAMALTIEIEATFDSIYAVIRAAESMPRLVRITGVQISTRQGAEDVAGTPVLEATISLDSIYEPLTREAF